MSGRHRASTRRRWWQLALPARRRGAELSPAREASRPAAPALVLVGAAGVCGVLVGSTLDPAAGTALMTASALAPSAVLGRALGRARGALLLETRRRHRLAGEVAVSDDQMRRLSDRLGAAADAQADAAAELEATRRQLRRVRVELATSRAGLSGAREDAARARSALDAAVAARDELRAQLNTALAEAEAAAEAARRAEAALVRAGAGAVAADRWAPPARIRGQRSFASVDMRVFDAFTEADMAAEDAVLDAPARRGRHAAEPVLEPRTPPRTVDVRRPTRQAARDVA